MTELKAAGGTEQSVGGYLWSPICDRMFIGIKHEYKGSNDTLLVLGGAAGAGIQMPDYGEQIVKIQKVKLCEGIIHGDDSASLRFTEQIQMQQESLLIVLVGFPVTQHKQNLQNQCLVKTTNNRFWQIL